MVLVKNMHLRYRSKHVPIRFYFAEILYQLGQIKPVAVVSLDKHAAIGTKATVQPITGMTGILTSELCNTRRSILGRRCSRHLLASSCQ